MKPEREGPIAELFSIAEVVEEPPQVEKDSDAPEDTTMD